MRKKIVPIVLALVVLFVLLIIADPEFREKVRLVVTHLNGWLGIDWAPIKGWRSAEWLNHMLGLIAL